MNQAAKDLIARADRRMADLKKAAADPRVKEALKG